MNEFTDADDERFRSMIKVLAVGQVPPPWGGQAVMIQKLLDANLPDVDLNFVPMSFSSDMDEIGRFRWKKLFQLPTLVFRIWKARFQKGCKILYYPPGGESITAICRDIFVLLLCRHAFHKTVFHVHAGGFTEVVDQAPRLIRVLAFMAYGRPDLVIQLTEKSPPDADRIRATKTINVPNGIADEAGSWGWQKRSDSSEPLKLLFVGVVGPSKGVLVLLEACALLKERGIPFFLNIIGRFYSPEFEQVCRQFVTDHDLEPSICFAGVQTGDKKWIFFRESDIFCFPTYFESENQSLVVLEAMQFSLPCVASDWRGISSMIQDGENGFLVPIKNPAVFADRVAELARDPVLRSEMGEKARELFLNDFTEAVWIERMNGVMRAI